jgi:Domain of unknown function (DUF5666)
MTINHRRNVLVALVAVAVAAILPAAAATGKSSSGLTSFHGKVTSVSTAGKTFRIKRFNGTSLTFRVTSTTVFERLGGRLSALRTGHAIEVKGKRIDGRWVARKVEPDDDARDDHGRGDDDGAGHDVGDDHGSDD